MLLLEEEDECAAWVLSDVVLSDSRCCCIPTFFSLHARCRLHAHTTGRRAAVRRPPSLMDGDVQGLWDPK